LIHFYKRLYEVKVSGTTPERSFHSVKLMN